MELVSIIVLVGAIGLVFLFQRAAFIFAVRKINKVEVNNKDASDIVLPATILYMFSYFVVSSLAGNTLIGFVVALLVMFFVETNTIAKNKPQLGDKLVSVFLLQQGVILAFFFILGLIFYFLRTYI